MSAEIERKFLLPAFPSAELEQQEITFVSKQYIYQTYLAFSEDQEIRVRKLVDKDGLSHYTHTFKSGHGLVREEIEYSISEEVYNQLLARSGLVPLEKVRTKVYYKAQALGVGLSLDRILLEIDEYKQINLVVVEVEFLEVDAAKLFEAPSWFGKELGQEEEFRNKTLWVKLQTP